MSKPSEIWREVKPKIGEMLREINEMESKYEKAQEEAYMRGYETAKRECEDCPKQAYTDTLRMDVYRKGLSDAWDAARKIASDNAGQNYSIFGQHFTVEILNTHSASECIEEIRAYEQEKEEGSRLRRSIKNVMSACDCSLDDIAEALQKMKES